MLYAASKVHARMHTCYGAAAVICCRKLHNARASTQQVCLQHRATHKYPAGDTASSRSQAAAAVTATHTASSNIPDPSSSVYVLPSLPLRPSSLPPPSLSSSTMNSSMLLRRLGLLPCLPNLLATLLLLVSRTLRRLGLLAAAGNSRRCPTLQCTSGHHRCHTAALHGNAPTIVLV